MQGEYSRSKRMMPVTENIERVVSDNGGYFGIGFCIFALISIYAFV